jgi:hypothetical protein
MTQNELVYSIREAIRQDVDDSDIDNREILFEINIQRALYYTNEFNKNNRSFDEDVTQAICMKLEVADKSDCGCQLSGCTVMRTVKPLPPTLKLHTSNAIVRVTGIDAFSKNMSFVPFSRILYVGDGKFDQDHVYVTQHANGHLYLKSSNNLVKLMEYIYVVAVFENPLDAADFTDCNTEASCYSADSQYPMKANVLAYIKDLIVNRFTRKLSVPEDKANNADNG